MAATRPLSTWLDPKSVSAEAFRTLRTNLQFTSPDKPLKTILVTSASPGEGKSTVSSNLAVALAQSGRKVALVGCDLRKPVLHEIFMIPNRPGLTSLLTGQATFEEVLVKTELEELVLLPSGPVPPNPSELLQSKVMGEVLEKLKSMFDYVLFDAAPVVAVTDAAVLGNQVDGVLLVVGARQVPRDVVLHAKSLLEKAKVNILGVVLNGIRDADDPNYYYYYYADDNQASKGRKR